MEYENSKRKDILQDLCDRLNTVAGQLHAMGTRRADIAAELDEYSGEISDIEENARKYVLNSMQWTGTQKSELKATASRENGKKGGRPPKIITELKKRLFELEENDTERARINTEIERLTEEWEAARAGRNTPL